MTIGSYLNMEVLFVNSVEDALEGMTNKNTYFDEECAYEFPSYIEFKRNLQYGFSAILAMCAYVECSFNSLIRLAAEVYPYPRPGKNKYSVPIDEIRNALNMKMKEKARWILANGLADQDFRKSRFWQDYLGLANIRNNLIHYKANYMQDAILIDFSQLKMPGALVYEDFPSSADNIEGLGTIFTQEYLKSKWNSMQSLVNNISNAMGCQIREDARLIDSDGKDGFKDYFVKTTAFLDVYPDGIRQCDSRNS